MKTRTLTEAREHMSELADPIEKTVLTRNGQPVAVVLGIDAFQSQQAMIELMRNPVRYSQVMAAHTRVQQGDFSQTMNLDDLENTLLKIRNREEQNGLQRG